MFVATIRYQAPISLPWSQQRVCGPRILPVNEEHVRLCSRDFGMQVLPELRSFRFQGADGVFFLTFSSLQVFWRSQMRSFMLFSPF